MPMAVIITNIRKNRIHGDIARIPVICNTNIIAQKTPSITSMARCVFIGSPIARITGVARNVPSSVGSTIIKLTSNDSSA